MSAGVTSALGCSKILCLPAEIRCHIYNLLLLVPDDHLGRRVFVEPFSRRQGRDDILWRMPGEDEDENLEYHRLSLKTGLHSAILATCKTIHSEASPILYAGNGFAMWVSHAAHFPVLIGSHNANLLKDVTIYANGLNEVPNRYRWDQAFRHCSNLRRVDVGSEFIIDDGEKGQYPGTGSQYHESTFIFFKRIQLLLKMHPSLEVATSPYAAGQGRHHSHYSFLDVSLLAAHDSLSAKYCADGNGNLVLDLDTVLDDLRAKLGKRVRNRRRPIACSSSSHS
ncbi:MAG: hypothetical protein Q9170_005695 [Blastenia crenularia]